MHWRSTRNGPVPSTGRRASAIGGAGSDTIVGGAGDDTLVVDAADTVLHLVLDAAAALGNSGVESEQTLARQTLLRYFLDEPEVADMRRARLAAHVQS